MVRASSPMRIGTIGDSVSPMTYPSSRSPWRRRCTFAHSCSRSSGCDRTTLTAAATLAMLDGDPDAVNTYARARKCSARSSEWFDTQTPPIPASDFENVPTMKSTSSSTP